tara:strand:- start:24740 stop:25075 length:336 start_codon:yes stop_codon:yes gene_type:complete
MEQIEIIIIVVLFLAIVFKLIKIFKYFVAIFFMLTALYFLGAFEHPAVVDFNNKYKISQTFSEWNEKLGFAGTIENIFGFFKNEINEKETKTNKQQCLIDNNGDSKKCEDN